MSLEDNVVAIIQKVQRDGGTEDDCFDAGEDVAEMIRLDHCPDLTFDMKNEVDEELWMAVTSYVRECFDCMLGDEPDDEIIEMAKDAIANGKAVLDRIKPKE